MAGGGVEVDAVDADAVARHDAQGGRGVEDGGVDLVEAGEQGVDAVEPVGQLAAGQRPAEVVVAHLADRVLEPGDLRFGVRATERPRGDEHDRAVRAHGSITTLSASPERAASNAAPASASGRRAGDQPPGVDRAARHEVQRGAAVLVRVRRRPGDHAAPCSG